MNLPTYIITCSPLAMNLLTHDTVKHLLVQVHITNTQTQAKIAHYPLRYRLALPISRLTKF